MFPIPDAWAAFYLTCFLVGFLFVFVSLILGIGHDTLHLPAFFHGDTGGDADGLGHGGTEVGGHGEGSIGANGHGLGAAAGNGHQAGHYAGHGISPINLSTIMAFLTWFGGAGYILRVYTGALGLLSVVIASLAGLLGGAVIFYFLARVLLPGQRFLDEEDYRLVGTIAQVTMPIRAETAGEIVYSKGGSRRSDGARSVDGSAIEHGTEVVIVRYEHGIAYVEPWKSFVAKG